MTTDPSHISERERDILRLVATGATNQQIAYQLNISVNTVKVHLRNIFGKIGATSRTEATLHAMRLGLIEVAGIPTPAELEGPPLAAGLSTPLADSPGVPLADLAVTLPQPAPPGAPALPPIVAVEAAAPASDAVSAPVMPATPVTPDVPLPTPGPARRLSPLLVLLGLLIMGLAITVVLLVVRPTNAPTLTSPTSTGLPVPDLNQRWRPLTAMPSPRAGFALASSNYNSQPYLYLIGGSDGQQRASSQVSRYDLTAGSWQTLQPKPTGVTDVRAAVIGNRVYVPGGQRDTGEITDVFEVYDPQDDRWMALAALPAPRSGYGLAAVEGKLYLFGGWDGTRYHSTVWQYNPDSDSWSERQAMPTVRAFADAVAIEGQIYVIGGRDASGPLTANERYTPAADLSGGQPWTSRAPLPAPLQQLAASSAGGTGLVFVVGGSASDHQMQIYSVARDQWTSAPTPLGALRDLRAQSIGNNLYVLGGQNDRQTSTSVYEYEAIYNVLLPIEMRPN